MIIFLKQKKKQQKKELKNMLLSKEINVMYVFRFRSVHFY